MRVARAEQRLVGDQQALAVGLDTAALDRQPAALHRQREPARQRTVEALAGVVGIGGAGCDGAVAPGMPACAPGGHAVLRPGEFEHPALPRGPAREHREIPHEEAGQRLVHVLHRHGTQAAGGQQRAGLPLGGGVGHQAAQRHMRGSAATRPAVMVSWPGDACEPKGLERLELAHEPPAGCVEPGFQALGRFRRAGGEASRQQPERRAALQAPRSSRAASAAR